MKAISIFPVLARRYSRVLRLLGARFARPSGAGREGKQRQSDNDRGENRIRRA